MTEKKLVWDLPLRLFHWLFGLSIIATWIAIEIREEQLHIYLGYFIIFLLFFRFCWGIWGTTHSQFRHFFPWPKQVKNYLCALLSGNVKETAGHNPLGSLMVFLMFAVVTFQVATGLFLEGEVWSGPYERSVSSDTADTLENLHNTNFSIIQVLILVHILAILGHYFFKKQNLIIPMITGKKNTDIAGDKAVSNSRLFTALIILAIAGGFVYWLVIVAPPPPPPPPSNDALFLY